MKYDILLLDPPWHYRDNKSNDPKLGGKSYAMMTDDQLADIPFADITNKHALMFCWLVMPKLYEGLQLMKHWGFEPTTCAFTWIKLNKSSLGANDIAETVRSRSGIWLDRGIYSGLGSYTCGNTELCYIGKRGNGLKRQNKSVKQIMFAPLGRHSAKPVETHKRIDALYGQEYKRVEFFAREQPYAEHWDATGYDYDGVDVHAFIESHY